MGHAGEPWRNRLRCRRPAGAGATGVRGMTDTDYPVDLDSSTSNSHRAVEKQHLGQKLISPGPLAAVT